MAHFVFRLLSSLNRPTLRRLRPDRGGFTLLEIAAALLIAGILTAVTWPQFNTLIGQGRVRQAEEQILNTLKTAQRNAIRQAKACELAFSVNGTKLGSVSEKNGRTCLRESVDLPEVNAYFNTAQPTIRFNYRGGISGNGFTVVLTHPSSNTRRCVVAAGMLGLIRTGDYRGDLPDPLTGGGGNCVSQPR